MKLNFVYLLICKLIHKRNGLFLRAASLFVTSKDDSGVLKQCSLHEIYWFEKKVSLFEALLPIRFLLRNLQGSTELVA
jgi:hypothetical protein